MRTEPLLCSGAETQRWGLSGGFSLLARSSVLCVVHRERSAREREDFASSSCSWQPSPKGVLLRVHSGAPTSPMTWGTSLPLGPSLHRPWSVSAALGWTPANTRPSHTPRHLAEHRYSHGRSPSKKRQRLISNFKYEGADTQKDLISGGRCTAH